MDRFFTRVASVISALAGKPGAFVLSLLVVIVWAVTGPVFRFSDTWQLVINTGTTIVTFLMVFLIQNTQNRDGAAIQTKLDELIRASDAEDEFMGIEKLTDQELERLHEKCARMARNTQRLLRQAKDERSARAAARGAASKPKAAPRKSPPRKSAPRSSPPAKRRRASGA
jgi:low affinity Fe/Cu permease